MKLLLDTHLLLWAAGRPDRLSVAARKLLNNPRHELYFSAASLWEITIKNTLGRRDFQADPRQLRQGLLANGYSELAITSEHAVNVDTPPALHSDPFDRILLSQAAIEGVTLVTTDEQLARYPGPVRKV